MISITSPVMPAAVADWRVLLPLVRCSLVNIQVPVPALNIKLTINGLMKQ
jgi:hypothetical protein